MGGWILKNRRLLIVISIVLTLVIIGCRADTHEYSTLVIDDYNNVDLNSIDHYEIEVDFDPKAKVYSVNQKVTYVNNTGIELSEIYFHMYPNAYKELETAPILFD